MGKDRIFRVVAPVFASTVIGEVKAKTRQEAIDKILDSAEVHTPSLCHYCAGNIEVGDVDFDNADAYAID